MPPKATSRSVLARRTPKLHQPPMLSNPSCHRDRDARTADRRADDRDLDESETTEARKPGATNIGTKDEPRGPDYRAFTRASTRSRMRPTSATPKSSTGARLNSITSCRISRAS